METMNAVLKKYVLLMGGFLFFWMVLTIWVQYNGKQKMIKIGDAGATKKALIVYHPDPIYNLDEQVCVAFAEGLSHYGVSSDIKTIALAENNPGTYDLYVFCANTYNWAPDWMTFNYIKRNSQLANQNTVAITLGSGSTRRSKKMLEEILKSKNANLLDSKTYWLLKPNDEKRLKEKNNEVAADMAKKFGERIGKKIKSN